MNEAETLKALFETIPKGKRAQFCRDNEIPGGVAMVYQHIKGLKPMSLQAAVGYSLGFNKPLNEISPRLAAIIDRLPKTGQQTSNLCAEPAAPTYTSLMIELTKIAETIDDRGMHILIDRAEEIAVRHPRQKKEAA